MIQNEDKKSVALSYFTVAEKFLRLSILSTKELIQSGNKHIITSREKITYEKLEEETKQSDLNISIPILFNFYHGIELVLKGILISGNIKITKIHKLTKLINKANRLKLEDSELIKTIRSVTTELPTGSFLYDFFQEYGIDDQYQSFKYPYRTDGLYFSHENLKYGGQRTIDDWKKIHDAAKNILGLAVEYYEDLDS